MAMGSTTWAMQCPPAFTAPEGGLGTSRGAEKSDCPCPWHNARHHTCLHPCVRIFTISRWKIR